MSKLLKPIPADFSWNERNARHLLNRAGFGVPYSSIDSLVRMGAKASIETLVAYDQYPDNIVEPEYSDVDAQEMEIRAEMKEMAAEDRQKKFNELQRLQREEIESLKVWWIDQMGRTPRPLQEKMTLFWHGHFATSGDKVKEPQSNYDLNKIFRENATGNLKTLTFEVGKSSAMLRYLDNNQNRKGHPNENWSRELMELFTLGIGHYTEDDIKEAARAFSGYTDRRGQFTFVANQHDYGTKTFLGQTGTFDGADIINIIFQQPQAARFISRKLWEYFVYENPSDELVEELATILRTNDYELKPLLRAMFSSQEFYGTKAMAGQIKSPAQYVVMLMDQLQYKPDKKVLINLALRGLGQDLFYPPNVKGWPGNRAWINTNTLLIRYNIPAYVLLGEKPQAKRELRLDEVEVNGRIVNQETGERRKRAERLLADRRRNAIRDIAKVYEPYEGKPAGEALDGVVNHLLGRPIGKVQKTQLMTVLMPGDAPNATFSYSKVGKEKAVAALHLVMSMAEYQVC
ncbi:DUF1800 domain-containing protein [Candidatus Sumerlaeota bacterium]|nr:DUF1800 domain-containing protein [Candidatus Sumerlaeota bacterium]